MRLTKGWLTLGVLGLVGNAACVTEELRTYSTDISQCAALKLCPLLSYQSSAPPNPKSYPSDEAYACALDALATRKNVLLYASTNCEGTCSGTGILIRPDGTAVTQDWVADPDGDLTFGKIQLHYSDLETTGRECTLREPSFYATCDHTPGGDCDELSDWFASCGPIGARSCGAL